jgi:hypothetical protein
MSKKELYMGSSNAEAVDPATDVPVGKYTALDQAKGFWENTQQGYLPVSESEGLGVATDVTQAGNVIEIVFPQNN